MIVRPARAGDLKALAGMRFALWPDEPLEVRLAETRAHLSGDDLRLTTFVVEDFGELLAFAEVSLRYDYVSGCETSPVAFLEGIYVCPEYRRQGIGRSLVAAAETWGRDHGCAELGSDARLDNPDSHRFHGGAGFEETGRVVYFRKPI